MPIAVTANSLQQWPSPSKRRPVSHTVRDGRASLSHRANDRRTCYRFFNFWPWELTAGPKVTKRGDDLVDSEIYQPAKFHRCTPTHARDIRYQNPAYRQNERTNDKNSNRYIPRSVKSAPLANVFCRQQDAIYIPDFHEHFVQLIYFIKFLISSETTSVSNLNDVGIS